MDTSLKKINIKRKRRALRVRRPLRRQAGRPRLTVCKSNQHIHAQLIDDVNGVTLASASTSSKEFRDSEFGKKSCVSARKIGTKIAEQALEKGVKDVVFDRGSAKYHGILAELATAAREAGLKF
ncbi:50S ribosomal protein L18 [Chlamydiales bacterium SCGC AG-110-M15]|nr:50S ribosomal protein L18 [Chlamydiales bacterium SCGC AG-110-M15]